MKRKGEKRIICTVSVLIALVIIYFSFYPGNTVGAAINTQGDYSYEINDNEVTITRYTGTSKVVNVPSEIGGKKVVAIKGNGFEHNESLESVSLPATLKWIGSGTFAWCKNLKEVKFQRGLTTIGEEAFYDCEKLEVALLPDSVTELHQSAFDLCESLKEVTIPNGVHKLPSFHKCISLKMVNISEEHPDFTLKDEVIFSKDKSILYRYLANKNSSYKIPESVKKMDESAFAYASIEKIEFPAGIISIPKYAFYGSKLKAVSVSSNIKQIEYQAFAYCKDLKTITLSDSITSVGDPRDFESAGTFVGCDNLKEFVVDKNNKTFTVKDGVLYTKEGKSLSTLVFYPPKKQGSSFTIPEGVVGMGTHAFYKCDNLKNLYISESVKGIYCYFKDCKNLNIMLPDTVQNFGASGHLEDFPILNNCIDCCFYVKEHSVAEKFFQSSAAKRAGLKYKVQKVKMYTYGKCRYIVRDNQITIVKYTGTSKTFSIPSKIKGKKVVAIGVGAFSDNKFLTKITIPTNVTVIGDKAFSSCKKLKKITLPKNITKIGSEAFSEINKECKFYVAKDSIAMDFVKKQGLHYIIQQ